MNNSAPSKIQLHKQSRLLELHYGHQSYQLSCEFLRVHSPSAEVKGHGPGQGQLQYGKKEVSILRLEMAGNYALRIVFDDGHDTGIYTWEYLQELCTNHDEMWEFYLKRLHEANKTRDPATQVVTLMTP